VNHERTPRAVSRIVAAIALAIATSVGAANAAESDPNGTAGVAYVGVDGDADDFGGVLARAGVLFDYESHLHHAGFALQNVHYAQDGWSADAPGIIGIYRNQKPGTLEGIRAEGGLVSVSGHVRVVGDATWSLRPRETTGIELIAAGDLVGTREAIERGIAYNLAGASIEQQFGERVTAIGLAGWQSFTDGNSRTLLRGRLIWSMVPEQGISGQVRYRQYTSSETDVDGAYFNPEHYRNWDAGLTVRRRVGTWTLSGLAAAGQERVAEESWKATGVAELRAEGPIMDDVRLSLGTFYSRAAGFANSSDYWYGGFNLNVIVPFAH
jgi:hypothetical protein